MNILNEIISSRRNDYETKTISQSEWNVRYRERTDFRHFRLALQNKLQLSANVAAVIAEIKRGSPSKGLFAPDLDPALFATEYETGGAACLSVLTEPRYFFGTLDDLMIARKNCRLPVLRKDFIVSEYQVYETALYADCMLLITRCLDAPQLKAFHDLATALQLDVLVEVFDESDIKKIEPFHFPLIGINNRNLATMILDTESARHFAGSFTPDQTIVAASGIVSRTDIERTMQAGIGSFLIGESLSKTPNRVETLRQFVTGTPNVPTHSE
ncbi:MAG: indole-3-glycerol phosphate synthase TrpC [Planctomycetaceae bacterium]|jgi:indole-3-glycerol phosphate synthase|nr:indole-3-glycerol phosphate synthase TrpC [Planctomycetaceae bacterium]